MSVAVIIMAYNNNISFTDNRVTNDTQLNINKSVNELDKKLISSQNNKCLIMFKEDVVQNSNEKIAIYDYIKNDSNNNIEANFSSKTIKVKSDNIYKFLLNINFKAQIPNFNFELRFGINTENFSNSKRIYATYHNLTFSLNLFFAYYLKANDYVCFFMNLPTSIIYDTNSFLLIES